MTQQNYPFYGSTDLHPARLTFEVYFAEGGFEYRCCPTPESPEECRLVTAYVNLCEGTHGVAIRRNLFATMNHVREHFLCLPMESVGPALSDLLAGLQKSILSVVVVLPDRNDGNFQLVQQAINAIVNQELHVQDVVVVISAKVGQWADLMGIQYFVESDPQYLEQDATALFKVLAGGMAPEVLIELDSEDLKSSLGSAAHPSRILHGQWSSQNLTLSMLNQSDYQVFGQTRQMTVSLIGTIKRLTVCSTLLKNLREISSPDACVIYHVTRGFFLPTDCVPDPVPLVAICRP